VAEQAPGLCRDLLQQPAACLLETRHGPCGGPSWAGLAQLCQFIEIVEVTQGLAQRLKPRSLLFGTKSKN
jgi:hypothetical protein